MKILYKRLFRIIFINTIWLYRYCLTLHKFFQWGIKLSPCIVLRYFFSIQKYVCNSIDIHRFDVLFEKTKKKRKNSGNCFDITHFSREIAMNRFRFYRASLNCCLIRVFFFFFNKTYSVQSSNYKITFIFISVAIRSSISR